jgi:hypothetical protein
VAINASLVYKTTMQCPSCGTLTGAMTTDASVVIIPCGGCGGSMLYVGGSFVFLKEDELEKVMRGRRVRECGRVVHIDMSSRYSKRQEISDAEVLIQIEELIGGKGE